MNITSVIDHDPFEQPFATVHTSIKKLFDLKKVPRICGPVVRTLEKIPELYSGQAMHSQIHGLNKKLIEGYRSYFLANDCLCEQRSNIPPLYTYCIDILRPFLIHV